MNTFKKPHKAPYIPKGMKYFLVIVATVVTLAIADEATSSTSDCHEFFDKFIGPVVSARDAGTPPEAMVEQFAMIGVPMETATTIIGMVYFVHESKDYEFIQADFLNFCLGEDV